jgi:PAS domain S-box-containing protein
MKTTPRATCLGKGCSGLNVQIHPEGAAVRRLIGLAGEVFRVPVAYAAMLGHHDRVMSRIGSNETYWRYLRTLPLGEALAAPIIVRDARERVPEGTDMGELRFAATAPMSTPCGQKLGVLVIADHQPRPAFSAHDLETLVALAAVVADRIELGILASRLTEAQLGRREAEERFRRLADAAPIPIACCESDGSCEFVNEAWVGFTGGPAGTKIGDAWERVMHPDHRDRVLGLYLQALQLRQPFTLELPMRRGDGVFRLMRGRGIPRFFTDGSFAGFVLSLTDVSDSPEAAGE